MNRYLLCCGDATDSSTWSGIPAALLAAGQRTGLLQGGLALQPSALAWRRRFWNLRQLLSHGRPGGFQYSPCFARALLAQQPLTAAPLALLSHMPLLPLHPWPAAWRVDFYLDATTRQVFEDYGVGRGLAPAYRRQVLAQERRALQAAGAVVTMAPWAAASVIDDCGVDPARVWVVPGGANLDEGLLTAQPPAPPPPAPGGAAPLRLGFLGKDWQRKGGPFLLQLAEALAVRGLPTRVRAVGPDPAGLPRHPCLDPVGFLDRRRDGAAFVAEVRSWHFGTLFSRAEAFGIGNRECLRLGVPVLAHAVGGIPATLPDAGCGMLFPPHPTPPMVADWIAQRLTPYGTYLAWRQDLAVRGGEFTWAVVVARLQELLG
jgi:glycosyltransferase involved in cell wall biosynthesis